MRGPAQTLFCLRHVGFYHNSLDKFTLIGDDTTAAIEEVFQREIHCNEEYILFANAQAIVMFFIPVQ
jgi:hypothetical protein